MELIGTAVERAGSNRVRLTGEVRYADSRSETESYWFEVPAELADELSRSGNPWLVCLAPLAAHLGEPLRMSLPVDRLLVRNVAELMRIWRKWYPSLHEVPLDIDIADDSIRNLGRTGVFFSGGVDSFFTVLRSSDPPSFRIDDLICVEGFDFPLEGAEEFEKHRQRLAGAAAELGKPLVRVATNLRKTRLRKAPWGQLWHGPALASVGLSLEGRYRYLLIASSSVYGEDEPWGSHPLTDHLLSTSGTQIIHDGAGYNRMYKTTFVASSGVARRALHVCYREVLNRNCGRCRKCSLTMLTLETLGVLGLCPTFPEGGVDFARAGRIYLPSPGQRRGVRRLRRLARERGRSDIARALDDSLRRSIARMSILRVVGWFLRPETWPRVHRRVRRVVLAGMVQ